MADIHCEASVFFESSTAYNRVTISRRYRDGWRNRTHRAPTGASEDRLNSLLRGFEHRASFYTWSFTCEDTIECDAYEYVPPGKTLPVNRSVDPEYAAASVAAPADT